MKRMMLALIACVFALAAQTACAHPLAPIDPVAHVELSRFMGRWYVIAEIPPHFEKGVFDSVETYTLQPNGRVRTSYRYRDGGNDAPVKTVHATGFVQPDTGNAVWGMQFVWPLKAEYIVAWLDPDYSETIIARNKRDYAWIMARTPAISEADYRRLVGKLAQLGYDTSDVRKVPQADAATAARASAAEH